MLIGFFSVIGAAIGALVGAEMMLTEKGKRKNEVLESSKNSILGTAREVKEIAGRR